MTAIDRVGTVVWFVAVKSVMPLGGHGSASGNLDNSL